MRKRFRRRSDRRGDTGAPFDTRVNDEAMEQIEKASPGRTSEPEAPDEPSRPGGGEVDVTDNQNGIYTFRQLTGQVRIEVTFWNIRADSCDNRLFGSSGPITREYLAESLRSAHRPRRDRHS